MRAGVIAVLWRCAASAVSVEAFGGVDFVKVYGPPVAAVHFTGAEAETITDLRGRYLGFEIAPPKRQGGSTLFGHDRSQAIRSIERFNYPELRHPTSSRQFAQKKARL